MGLSRENGSLIRAYVALIATFVAMIGAMILFLLTGERLTSHHVPLLEATATIKLELTEAQFWFEELRADRPESIRQVLRHFDEALWYTEAILYGGQREGETFPPAGKPELRAILEALREKILSSRSSLAREYGTSDESVGMDDARRHEATFRALASLAADAATIVRLDIAGRSVLRQRLLAFVIAGSVLAAGFLVLVFYRYEAGRRRDERDLRREKAYSESVVGSLPGVFYLFDREGRLLRWNRNFERISGYSGDELRSRAPWDFFEGADREHIARQIEVVFETGQATAAADLVTKDGRAIPHYFTGARIIQDGKEFLVGMGINVAEHKRAEQSLRALQDELLARQMREKELVEAELNQARAELVKKTRLATLGQLTATVSHEIRNPLGSIRTAIYSIAQELRGHTPLVDRALERAERNVLRCDRIIEELLDYTRVGEPKPEPTRVDRWLAEVLDEYPWPDGVVVTRAFAANVEIPIDRDRLRRCVVNLVTNACQAMDANRPGEARVAVETAVEGEWLRVRIRDTGRGIAPDEMDKVFEPFYTTKGFGVGLGLALVEQLMRQLGGDVSLESEAGRGVTATLSLPLTRNRES